VSLGTKLPAIERSKYFEGPPSSWLHNIMLGQHFNDFTQTELCLVDYLGCYRLLFYVRFCDRNEVSLFHVRPSVLM